MKSIGELYELQKQLDARIIKEKGLEGQDLLPNTILALQVEIGELANEWRGFKHWSNDREPRTRVEVKDPLGQCEGYVKNPLLEEYVDCLHFFLSIARQLDLPEDDLYMPDDVLEGETVDIFTEIINLVGALNEKTLAFRLSRLTKRGIFRTALYTLILLGEQRLGFNWDQIVDAYLAKNKVNHERQENGY